MKKINITIPSGVYVIAVSGGVDSMTLLDAASKLPNLHLIVAHLDHGIREESIEDRLLVQQAASKYRLPYIYDRVELGADSSEAEAREVRYKFLNKVKKAANANAIITAHHQDDVIETAILNLIRGTNRRGITSLKSTDEILRPFLKVTKKQIYDYAKANKIKWHEDKTNLDTNYQRNYIRHEIIPKLTDANRKKLIEIINQASETNLELDDALENYLKSNLVKGELNKYAFIILPHKASKELMATWLRKKGVRNYDSKLLEYLTVGAKTLKPGHRLDVNAEWTLKIGRDNLALQR